MKKKKFKIVLKGNEEKIRDLEYREIHILCF